MLSTFLKLWETILYQDLLTVVQAKMLISKFQTGTMPGTDAQITILARKILVHIARSRGKEIFSTQYDLNKAFNRVSRPLLWLKLHKMGITGHLWQNLMATYSDHAEFVTMGDFVTELQSLANGVRQGSILSPILSPTHPLTHPSAEPTAPSSSHCV